MSTKCVLFFLQLCAEHFFRPISIQRGTLEILAEKLVSFHVKCPLLLSAFIGSRTMSTKFNKSLRCQIYENTFSGSQIVMGGETDREPNSVKLIGTFLQI